MEAWATEFNLTHTQVGWIIGTAFWGFTLAMVFGGPLVDIIGLGRIISIAFFCHVAGIVLTIVATGFWTLFISTLLIGIANGSVEAACNPLITSMYTDEKTRRLNRFHAWFPTGIVIGGLVVYLFNNIGLNDWRTLQVPSVFPSLWEHLRPALSSANPTMRTRRLPSCFLSGTPLSRSSLSASGC